MGAWPILDLIMYIIYVPQLHGNDLFNPYLPTPGPYYFTLSNAKQFYLSIISLLKLMEVTSFLKSIL